MDRNLFLLAALAAVACLAGPAAGWGRQRAHQNADNEAMEAGSSREGKLLKLFQIVTFPNDPCVGSSTKNGTCYTSDECNSKGGVNAGSCAQGYGVCCVFTSNCGATSSENCTYVESTGAEVGQCRVKICRCSTNICQLRLDFNTFTISGPSTTTISTEKVTNGVPSTAGKTVTAASRCLTDTFSVTNPSGITPPQICGTNTGQHMYVDASEFCNELVFQLGTNGIGTALATRQWSIKVSQYDCGYENLAPEGCTQYYFGQTTTSVQTYNYDGGQHLADQNQNICIRRERSNCRICWSAANPTDFMTSGKTTNMGFNKGSVCCGYGVDGLQTMGFDCVVIPGAETMTMGTMAKGSEICGKSAGLVTATATGTAGAKTICSVMQPFNIRFLSDSYEFGDGAGAGENINRGFRLAYIQDSQNC